MIYNLYQVKRFNLPMKISICIPTWEQYGCGTAYLKFLLDSIKVQDFRNFNVIISDHSLEDEIKNLSELYRKYFDIIYIRNEEKRGNGPANTNVSIKNADGDIIKIMFQDDFFVSVNSLKIINDVFEEYGCDWLVNGCNHTNDGVSFFRPMIPSWNDKILFGANTISSPSVLSFRNSNNSYFDENLTMLMDCEYYYQLYIKYGEPVVIKDILVSNRVHSNQISKRYKSDINEEINYIKNKYRC